MSSAGHPSHPSATAHGRNCARLSQASAEPMFATAGIAPRWILLEEPGPGGCDAVLEQRLPPGVARGLKTIAEDLHARIVLIRRHGRYRPQGRRCYAVSSVPGASWVEYHTLDSASDVLDIDWLPLRDGRSVGGRLLPHPLYLVCTNGRHDPCCAEFGRAAANALQDDFGERVWECSHLGGDRFAGNMVVLPEGLYFGRVTPAAAPRIARGYEQGRIDLDHYRGRSCYPVPVQAAEYYVRRDAGIDAVDGLRLVRSTPSQPGVQAEFETAGGRRFAVEVRRRHEAVDRPLTCRGTDSGKVGRFDLVAMSEHSAAR